MKTSLITTLLALASSGLALTFTPTTTLEVGKNIDLRALTDTPGATFTSSHPEIITIRDGTAVVRRLSPTGVNVTLTAQAGADRVTRTVTTAGIEIVGGVGLMLADNAAGDQKFPSFIVRARGIDGRPPATLNIAADMPFYRADTFVSIKAYPIGSMRAFIGQLNGPAASTIRVEAGGYSREVTVNPAALPVPARTLVDGITARVEGRTLQLTGRLPVPGTVNARVRQNGSIASEWWKNAFVLPETLPLSNAPSGKSEVLLRVYTWPLMDDTTALPEGYGFVQYRVAEVTLR
jgi:hypothetical protein